MSEADPILEKSTGVTHPLVLLDSMITRGGDPDTLKKLMDLAERWQANQAKAAYTAAMSKCQAEIGAVAKNRTNAQTNTPYADLEAVCHAAKPHIAANGFSLSFGEGPAARGEKYWRMYCDVKHVGGHQERYEIELPIDDVGPQGKANKTAIHGAVSSGSYAMRLLIVRIFNITIANSDNDGQREKPIAEAKVAEIRDLMQKTGYDKKAGKFLAWLEAKSIETMTEMQYKKAVDSLTRARREQEAAAKEGAAT